MYFLWVPGFGVDISIEEQVTIWMLPLSDTYCLIEQFYVRPDCVYLHGGSERGKAGEKQADRYTLSSETH